MKEVKVYSIDAVADFLGVSFSSLDAMIRKGRVPAPRWAIGGRMRYYLSEDLPILRTAVEKVNMPQESIHA
ncbi:MAG TPA: MerR family transcriptional regulator [Verrucomicrobiae bacterium]|nr:MerR family transcriptional regulator [Verrucomicrobiae bacterium]